MGGPCVGLEIRDIITASDISLMNLKEYLSVYYRTQMWSFLLLLESDSLMILFCVMDLSIVSYSIVCTEDGNI